MAPHSQKSQDLMDEISDFDRPEYFTDWRLSQLEFNQRVLAQSVDTFHPLLERLKFLCIFSTNLDEFFEVRVAGLKEEAAHATTSKAPDQISPQESLRAIYRRSYELV